MKEYHKINSVYSRTRKGELILGEFSDPIFEYLKDNIWTFTEKVDETNIRIMYDGVEIRYGGKTDNAQLHTGLLERLIKLFPQDRIGQFKAMFDISEVCLYGEGYGARIQKGGGNYKKDGQDFVLFDVKIGDWWLRRKYVEDVGQKLGIDVVPIRGQGTLDDMVGMARAGFDSHWGEFSAEGIVAQPLEELRTRSGHRVITKIKTKDFERAILKEA